MEGVKKTLDELFKNLPRNAAAKRIKAEMLENLMQRYEELAAEQGPDEAQRQVIAEIGSAEEIREAINLSAPKKQMTATVIQAVIVILCIGYAVFIGVNHVNFKTHFILLPILINYCAILPLLYFFGTWLAMKIVDHYAQPKGLYIKNKMLRRVFFIAGILFLALYTLVTVKTFIPINVFIPPQVTNLIWQNSFVCGIASALLYLGGKK